METGGVWGDAVVGDGVEDVDVEVDEAGDDEQVLGVEGLVGPGVVDRIGDGGDLGAVEGDVARGVEGLGGVDEAAVFD